MRDCDVKKEVVLKYTTDYISREGNVSVFDLEGATDNSDQSSECERTERAHHG